MPEKNVAGIAGIATAMALIALGFFIAYASSGAGSLERQPASAAVTTRGFEPAENSHNTGVRTAVEPDVPSDRRSATLSLPGTVEPAETVEVHSDVAGHIGRLAVDLGSPVRRGDLLAEVDCPESLFKLAKARIAVQQARARIATTKAGVKVADSALRTARAELEAVQAALKQTEATASYRRRQYDRIAELVTKGTLQNRIGEEEQARLRGDEASELAARARVAIMRASLSSAEAKFEAALAAEAETEEGLHLAEVDLQQAGTERESCRVRSPIDGIVTRRRFHVGEFVHSAASGGSGALFTVVQTRIVRVVAHVSDRDASRVQEGERATFRPESSTDREHVGTVSRTAVADDPTTHTMRIEVDLENSNQRLRPGERGTIQIDLDRAR